MLSLSRLPIVYILREPVKRKPRDSIAHVAIIIAVIRTRRIIKRFSGSPIEMNIQGAQELFEYRCV